MKKLFIPFGCLVIIFSSCTQDEKIITPEWPFEFVAEFEGDPSVSTITLHTSIGYPLENETILQGTIKSISKDDEFELNETDEVKIKSIENVYADCVAWISVGVARRISPVDKGERFVFFRKSITITTPNDSILVVNWPKDSVLFTTE